MDVNEVIKFPILSEKTYAQMANGVYTFAVDPRTNRSEVKKTIEFIFEVKVAKVNIISVDKKPTQLGRSKGFTNKIKKAIVTLSEGQINIFPDEVEAPKETKETKEKTKAKDKSTKEMTDVEKKVAAKIAAKAKAKKEQASIAAEQKTSSSTTSKKETIKPNTNKTSNNIETKKEK